MIDDEPQGAEPNAQDLANAGSDRQAAALEMFNKQDATPEPPAAEPAAPELARPEGAAPAAEPRAAEPQLAAEGDIAKAAFFNDPAFQKYYKEAEGARTTVAAFRDIFDKGRYAIKDDATLRNVHEDAFLLYDIAAGKKSAGELLEVFKKNWEAPQFKAVLQELADYAKREGVEGKQGEPQPWEKRLSALEQERETERQTAEAKATEERQMKTVDSLEKEIVRLCTEKGIAAGKDATPEEKKAIEEEISDYVLFVSAELGKNPELVKQLEKGQFGEAQRLFTLRHNTLVARAKRYSDGQIKKFDERGKVLPNTPRREGGAPPAAKPAARGTTAERALEQWNKQ